MKRFSLPLLFAAAVAALYITGCSSSANPPSTTTESTSTDSQQAVPGDHAGHEGHGDHADHEHHADAAHDGQSEMEKMHAELAKLSSEDRASAEKQHVCPVSGEMLGTMGAPLKIDVNGEDVWICCGGCKDKLLANPDEYLAKLKKD